MQCGTAVLAGNLALLFFAELPDARVLFLSLVGLGVFSRVATARWLAVACLSFLWAWHAGVRQAERTLPYALEGEVLELRVRVASLPAKAPGAIRFDAEVEDAGPDSASFRGDVRLKFFTDRRRGEPRDPIELGDTLAVRAKLKRPWGRANPGGFDYERYLFHRELAATGYVLHYRRLAPAGHPRQKLLNRLTRATEGLSSGAAIRALSLGVGSALSRARKELLVATGTRHLFAVSGLHIGTIFALVFFLAGCAWRLVPRLDAVVARRDFASATALPAAACYAWLAGLSLPTQRALLMLACVCVIGWTRRRLPAGHTLAFALTVVLFALPLSALSVSFWFSFLATAVIVWFVSATPEGPAGRQLLLMQLCLFPATLALSMLAFHQGALNAPLSNLIAIPLVSFAILPMSLLTAAVAAISVEAAGYVAQMTDALFGVMWKLLEWCARLSDGATAHTPPVWSLPFAAAGFVVFVMAHRVGTRASALLLFLPFWFGAGDPDLAHGEFEAVFLDVGQSLAVVVRTRERVMLYDTGAAYPSGSEAAFVIAPYFRSLGVRRIDTLVVSHGDNDHAGGVDTILRMFDVRRVIASGHVGEKRGFESCVAGQGLDADGVAFAFLHPPDGHPGGYSGGDRNNASCVLRVGPPGRCLLLTGDIERAAERELLRERAGELRCPVVLVPHHGSLTSSSPGFIDAVRPDIAVVSSSRRNRYGFPKREVVRRYESRGVEVLNTATLGALSLRFPRTGEPCVAAAYRIDAQSYWHLSHVKTELASRCR